MSHIRIERRHQLSHAKARELAEQVGKEMREEFDFSYQWDGDALRFQRSGVHGQILVESTRILVEAKLGFFLIALKPKIESEIHKFLNENFG